jgi:predicted ATPase
VSLAATDVDRHPFQVPVVRGLLGKTLTFPAPVTIFVGENGSGKSTLLEGIACGADAIAIGTNDLRNDETLRAGQALAANMTLSWATKKIRRGFFLRAEDFFGYAIRIDRLKAELKTVRDSMLARTAKRFWNCSGAASARTGSTCSTNRKRRCPRRGSSPCWQCCG